jgi:hypothetical protein
MTTARPVIFADACVLYPAILRDVIMQAALEKAFTVHCPPMCKLSGPARFSPIVQASFFSSTIAMGSSFLHTLLAPHPRQSRLKVV